MKTGCPATSVARWLSVLLTCLGPIAVPKAEAALEGGYLKPDTSAATIQRHARGQPQPLWRVGVGQYYVEDLTALDADHLLVGLKSMDRGLPNGESLLLERATGQVIWRMQRVKTGQYAPLFASENTLLVRLDGPKQRGLLGIDLATGLERWRNLSKDELLGIFAELASGTVVPVARTSRGMESLALRIDSGQTAWAHLSVLKDRDAAPAAPVQIGNSLLVSSEHLQCLGLKDGAVLWSRPDINLSADDPPPQGTGELVFIARGKRLLGLAVTTGKTKWERKVDTRPTNLYPLGETLYVRGEAPFQDEQHRFSVDLPANWSLIDKPHEAVFRFHDSRTRAFMVLAYLSSVETIDSALEVPYAAVKQLAAESLRRHGAEEEHEGGLTRVWRTYTHELKVENEREPVLSCVGAVRADHGKALSFLGYIPGYLPDKVIPEIKRAFQSIQLDGPAATASVAERWRARGSPIGEGSCELAAYAQADGERRWGRLTPEPTISNLLERDGRLYAASSTTVFCFQVTDGKPGFAVDLTQTGRAFPVRLHLFENRVAFVGELIIAGLDATTGEKAYVHGFTPLSESTSLNGLDQLIPASEYMRAGISSLTPQESIFSTIAGLSGAESARYQNLANTYSRQASYHRSMGQSDQATTSAFKANLAARSAKWEADLAFAQSLLGVADTLLKALRIRLWQRHYEDLLGRQQLFRRSILLADQRLDSGVFAGRTHRLLSFSGDGDFATLAVVHLASGQRRDVILSPTYLDYGLWNLVDWERGLVFHHGWVSILPITNMANLWLSAHGGRCGPSKAI